MNYYRSFSDYGKVLDYWRNSLIIVKKSILNGYYYHIKAFMEIFFMSNEFENIYKIPELKTEMMFIFTCLIDNIIADEIEIFMKFVFNRKIFVKHFNFGDEFKANLDFYTKEYVNYLLKLWKKQMKKIKKE